MHPHCENCFNTVKCSKRKIENCPVRSCYLKCGQMFHDCKAEEHKILCSNEIVNCVNVGYGCPIKMQRYRVASHLPNCPASIVVCTLLLDHWPLYPELGDKSISLKDTMATENGLPSSFLGIDIPSDIATSVTMPYPYGPSCKRANSVDVFAINPIKPYTFSCNQSFRREEYNWHYKNIHNDIHCSLNGPIVQWCPLAQYGCNFSRKRLYPAPKGSLISYNNIVGSFGVIPSPQTLKENLSKSPKRTYRNGDSRAAPPKDENEFGLEIDFFSNMPFEILQKIAWYLDSFSLANLSLTSRHIRNVCKTMLEKKGMVHVSWIKELNKDDQLMKTERVRWKINGYRWCFSNGMSPITQWIYLDGMNMSNHMKTCRYFKKKIFKDEQTKQCKLFDPAVEY